ncbi:MAG: CmcI family methyltransferase [Accumulibacter sp.]|jgi:predicted O-methyltransferase YrrM|uniref:O-methyltransferase n=1 Tax=Accumulibacter sp. TaxID=2053492 RepID=UPI002FC3462E
MKTPIHHRRFDYQRSQLPNRQLALLETDVVSLEQARQKTGASIGYPGWCLIYHLLLSHLDRNRTEIIVETGTNWGCSTIALAQALIDSGCEGRVITFEIEPDNALKAQHNLSAAGVDGRVELHIGDSIRLLPQVLESINDDIRVAFLDASHLLRDIEREFEALLPKLSGDALVIFDNTYRIADDGEDPRVNGFLKLLQARHGGNLINLEFVSWFTPGLAIWQRTPNL